MVGETREKYNKIVYFSRRYIHFKYFKGKNTIELRYMQSIPIFCQTQQTNTTEEVYKDNKRIKTTWYTLCILPLGDLINSDGNVST